MTLLVHFQKNVMGNHGINILALKVTIYQYHQKYNTITEYTEAP